MMQILGPENFSCDINPGRYIIITELDPQDNLQQKVEANLDNEGEENLRAGDAAAATSDDFVGRVLHLEFGDMFNVTSLEAADVVMLETDIPCDLQPQLCNLLGTMVEGARTLTYLDLRKIWCDAPTGANSMFPFKQVECNKHLSDRFPTSWSVQRGHHFYLWRKVMKTRPAYLN